MRKNAILELKKLLFQKVMIWKVLLMKNILKLNIKMFFEKAI